MAPTTAVTEPRNSQGRGGMKHREDQHSLPWILPDSPNIPTHRGGVCLQGQQRMSTEQDGAVCGIVGWFEMIWMICGSSPIADE